MPLETLEAVPGRVVVLDLQGTSAEAATARAREILADRAGGDLARMVVLDSAAALFAHHETYQELRGSQRIATLLCVAVGPHGDPDDPTESRFKVPATIGAGDGSAAVLWVGDPAGVRWRPLASSAALTRPDQDGRAGLGQLIDLLSVEAIYDRVAALSRDVRGGVASPGLQLAGGDADPALGLSALATVLETVSRPGSYAQSDRPHARDFLAAVLGPDTASTPDWPRLAVRGAALAETEAAARSAGEQAIEAMALVRGMSLPISGPGLVRAAGEQVAEAGERLAELQALTGHLTRVVGPAEQQAAAGRTGLRPPPPSVAGRTALGRSVGALVDGLLADGCSLADAQEQLSLLESKLRPPTPKEYQNRMARLCPPALIDRLVRPPAFPTPQWWLPLGGLAAMALAAIGGTVWLLPALAVLVLWIAAAAVAWSTPGIALWDRVAGIAVADGAAVLGLAAGIGLANLLAGRLDSGQQVMLGLAGLLAGALLIPLVVLLSWQQRAAIWQEEVPEERGPGAVDGLKGLIAGMVGEWSRTPARDEAGDALRCGRATLDGLLNAIADQPAPPPNHVQSEPGQAAFTQQVIHHQFLDVQRRLLSRRWAELTSLPPIEHQRLAREALHEKLSQWQERLSSHDPLGPLDFAVTTDPVPAPPEPDVGDYLSRTTAAPADGDMWQLTAPADLAVLDLAPERMQVARFAPSAFRKAADQLPPGVTWSEGNLRAGALRLIPVRPEFVVKLWGQA
ncbi:hypothetical protein GCM10027456_41390 [Kineosporia babensis]